MRCNSGVTLRQVGICSNFAAGGIFLSTLPQTRAAIGAFEAGVGNATSRRSPAQQPMISEQATYPAATTSLPQQRKLAPLALTPREYSPCVRL
jgi:hypothetical protein